MSVSPDDLAYILYTSGSTGQPKGVMQTHRNGLHMVMLRTGDYRICNEDRLISLYSPATNGTAAGILSALLNGASVHPISIQGRSTRDVMSWLIEEKITVLSVVVSLFRQIMNSPGAGDCFSALRLLSLSGEAVAMQDVELYKQHFPEDCVLINALSATETGTFRRYCIDKATSLPESAVPAGYAVQDFEVLLLDDAGAVVESNQVGEIAVRSRYLSLGYWRKPELTTSKFLPDPDGGDARIDLTGDVGRILPDGCLIPMGRKDFQVKLRGHRIELGEIEAVLGQHAAVRQAVVLARADAGSEKQLAAYIVPAPDLIPSVADLRRFLLARLPNYMVPAAFVFMGTLPLTPNMKVDRGALPAPDPARTELGAAFVAPRTPLEGTLARMWAELLGFERVGVHDHFLDLGGDSMLATQFISRVRSAFQVELPLRSVFDGPTVADLAVKVTASLAELADPEELDRMLEELDRMPVEEQEQ